MDSRPLPRAPADAIGPTGPRLGRYAGWLGRAGLSSLAPAGLLASLSHAVRERRWQRAFLVTEAHLAVVDLVEGGAVASGACWLVDRRSGEVLLDRAAVGLPGLNGHVGERPGAGARASFASPGMDLLLERRSDRFQLSADLGEARLDAYLDSGLAPDPFALVAPLEAGGLRVAQVSGPLPLTGWLEVGGARHRLEGGAAALDFGAGIFPGRVASRRLTALEPGAAAPRLLHLAHGPAGGEEAGAGEDVLLGDGGPRPLPPVALEAGGAPDTVRWRAVSRDAALDLEFRPVAVHRESRKLLLLSTQRAFLVGTLSGFLPAADGRAVAVRDWPALAEDFSARG